MFVIIHCHERDIRYVGQYTSIDEARTAMYNNLISKMKDLSLNDTWIKNVREEIDKMSIDNATQYEDEYDIRVSLDSIWSNFNGSHYDWKILEIEEVQANE